MRSEEPRFLLVREDLLPEAIVKTLQAKQLLEQRDEITVHEAVEAVGLSRSAFYKYKDGVFELNRLERERIVTISMHLQHKSGILSRVLSLIASFQGNVLTIQQTIPLQGMAHVAITIDASGMEEGLSAFMDALIHTEGVTKAAIIGQGS